MALAWHLHHTAPPVCSGETTMLGGLKVPADEEVKSAAAHSGTVIAAQSQRQNRGYASPLSTGCMASSAFRGLKKNVCAHIDER